MTLSIFSSLFFNSLNEGKTIGSLLVLRKWSGHEVPTDATFFKFCEFTNSKVISDLSKWSIFELSIDN